MGGKRRALMVDATVAEEVREAATRRGMTLSAYLRALLQKAIEAESQGLYAPSLITHGVVVHVLSTLGFVMVPAQLLSGCRGAEREAEEAAERLARMLQRLGLRGEDVMRSILENVRGSVFEGERIVLLLQGLEGGPLFASVVKGLARGFGLRVREHGDSIVIIEPGGMEEGGR